MCKKAKKKKIINRRKINIQKRKKHDEINRQDGLAIITNMLKMLKEAEENMTMRRREMNVKNPKWKVWRRKICLKWDHTDGINNLEYTEKKAVTKDIAIRTICNWAQRGKTKGQNVMICWTTSSDPVWKNCNCSFRQGDSEDTESKSWEFSEIWRWLKSDPGKSKVKNVRRENWCF